MLRVSIETNGKIVVRDLLVIDAHSHMGKDVDAAEMMNPMTPGKGTFDFWTLVENRIRKDWDDGKSAQEFSANFGGKISKIKLDFVQMPLMTGVYKAIEKRNKSGKYANAFERIKLQKLIDQAVCFPFQDVFRDKKPEALYRASNTNISRQVSRFPVSLRMIGYMRCDPMQGQKALDEIDFWAKQGTIRGLKLHPRSEGWVDNVTSQNAINVLMKAASYNWPVIFDTRGKQTIMDIGQLIASTRQQLQANSPELLEKFKVIIAHFAQGNVDDSEVYNTITQPNTWGDLSMLHGKGASLFLQSFRVWCEQNQILQKTGRSWSEYCLFATDYPYFGDSHAKDLIVYLFNQDFYEGGGNLNDSANILGLNQIRVLPEYGSAYSFGREITPISTTLQNTELLPANFPNKPPTPLKVDDLMYETIAGLVDDGLIEIKKLLFQFKNDWIHYDGEYCLETYAPKKKEEIIPLIFTKFLGDKLGVIGTLPKGENWEKFGYKYFDPKVRQMFHTMFQNNFPAAIESDAVNMLARLYR
jgi:predicted TIM-barrel fold metal-dependent hydrolase